LTERERGEKGGSISSDLLSGKGKSALQFQEGKRDRPPPQRGARVFPQQEWEFLSTGSGECPRDTAGGERWGKKPSILKGRNFENSDPRRVKTKKGGEGGSAFTLTCIVDGPAMDK